MNLWINPRAGESFTLLVKAELKVQEGGILERSVAWTSGLGDNDRFKFDPKEVKDNSPQDQNPAASLIFALFKVTAPEASGSYSISLSALGGMSVIRVSVREASAASFASIVKVQGPLLMQSGTPVNVNVTLQNIGSEAHKTYIYATDDATGEDVFAKVYSASDIAANQTITLRGTFAMPNRTLSLTVHGGHEQGGVDTDDTENAITIMAATPLPPTQAPSLSGLVREWGPWLAIVGASFASVQVVKYTNQRKRTPFVTANEKLKVAVVDCALCGGCEIAMADLGEDLLDLLPQKVNLVYAPVLMSAREYGPVDVALVVGSVRNEEDVKAVKEAREKAKVLVAFGTCPGFGGLNTLANLYEGKELFEYAYSEVLSMDASDEKTIPSVRVPVLTDKVRPLSEYVKVDFTIPGCPPPFTVVRSGLDAVLYKFAPRGRASEPKSWK